MVRSFSWKSFCKRFNINNPNTARCWKDALDRIPRGEANLRRAVRMMAIAYFDGRSRDGGRRDTRFLNQIAANLGFQYLDMAGQGARGGEGLAQGLAEFGCKVLRIGNTYQYRRTILRYSGSMYIRFARDIAGLVISDSWTKLMEYNFIERRLGHNFNRFFGDGEEDQQAKKDVILFFQKLAQQYRRFNIPFTVDDIQKLAPLSEDVSRAIIAEMIPQEANEEGEGALSNLDTLPTISIDGSGRTVFRLAENGKFKNETVGVTFLFKKSPDDSEYLAYAYYRRRNDGTFALEWQEGFEQGVPVEGIGSITRKYSGSSDEEEVIPLGFREGAGHVLVRVRNAENDCGFEVDEQSGRPVLGAGAKLAGGELFKVVSMSGGMLPVNVTTDDETRQYAGDRYRKWGVITVPHDADIIEIDGVEYEVKNNTSRYFDLEERADCIDHPGGRLYYTQETMPFSDAFFGENLEAHYEMPRGGGQSRRLYAAGEDWNITEDVLWQKGWIVLKQDGKQIARKAVSFIQDFSCRELQNEHDINDTVNATAVFDDGGSVKMRADARTDRLRFEHPAHSGFRFSVKVKRTGVYFELPGKKILPVPREGTTENAIREIAVKDFRDGSVCQISVGEAMLAPRILAVRGAKYNVIDGKKFKGSELLGQPKIKDAESDYFSVCVAGGNAADLRCYKFHLYDPAVTPLKDDAGREWRVIKGRDGDNLVLSYYVALSDAGKKKSVAYFPAHKQDKPIQVFTPAEEAEISWEEEANTGRYIETLRVPGFYAGNSGIEWGEGLLCFVGSVRNHPGGGHMVDACTNGFFVKPPDGVESTIGDDPTGLRMALAKKDVGKIESILRNATDQTKAILGGGDGLLQNLERQSGRIKIGDRNGRDVLNSFRNAMPAGNRRTEISGYLFAAGWHCVPRMNNGRLPDVLKGCWSRLMFTYQELQDRTVDDNVQDVPKIIEYGVLQDLPPREKMKLHKLLGDLGIRRGREEASVADYNREARFFYEQLIEATWRKYRQCGNNPQHMKIAIRDTDGDRERLEKRWCNHILSGICNALGKIDNGEERRDSIMLHGGRLRREVSQRIRVVPERLKMGVHKRLRKFFNQYQDIPYIFYAGYDRQYDDELLPSISKTYGITMGMVDECIRLLGNLLHEWRLNPSLESGQELRERLLAIEQIDESIRSIYRSGREYNGSLLNQRQISRMWLMTEWIDDVAYYRNSQCQDVADVDNNR